MLNNPRVKKTTGRAISSIIGFMKLFIRPITAPAINKSTGEPEKINPGIYLAAIRIAAQLAIILTRSRITLDAY